MEINTLNRIKSRLADLSHGLVWPAAAGNVLWTFLSLLLDPATQDDSPRKSQLAALSVLSLYLLFNWTWRAPQNFPRLRVLAFDLAHVMSICFCAIAVYYNSPWAEYSLLMVFFIAGSMHLAKASQNSSGSTALRLKFACANALGILIIIAGCLTTGGPNPWLWSLAMAAALLAWIYLKVVQCPQEV